MYGAIPDKKSRTKVRTRRAIRRTRSDTSSLKPLSLKHTTTERDIQHINFGKTKQQKKKLTRKKRVDDRHNKISVLLLIETNVLFSTQQQENLKREFMCSFPLPCIYQKRSMLAQPVRKRKTHSRSTSSFMANGEKGSRRLKVRLKYSKDVPGPYFGGTKDPAAFCELIVKHNLLDSINNAIQKKIQIFAAQCLRRHLGVPIDRYFLRILSGKHIKDQNRLTSHQENATAKFRQLNADLAVRNGTEFPETGCDVLYYPRNNRAFSPLANRSSLVSSPFREVQDNFVFPNRAMSPSLRYTSNSSKEISSGIAEGHPCEYEPSPSTPSYFCEELSTTSPSSRDQYNVFGMLPKTPSTPYGGIGYLPKTPSTPYGGIGYLPKTPGTPYRGFGADHGMYTINDDLLDQGENLIKRRMIHSRARSSGIF